MGAPAGMTMQRWVYTPSGRFLARLMISLLVIQPLWEMSQRYQWEPAHLRQILSGMITGTNGETNGDGFIFGLCQ